MTMNLKLPYEPAVSNKKSLSDTKAMKTEQDKLLLTIPCILEDVMKCGI